MYKRQIKRVLSVLLLGILVMTSGTLRAKVAPKDDWGFIDPLGPKKLTAGELQQQVDQQAALDLPNESEPNNTPATANLLSGDAVVLAELYPENDVDVFAFSATAGQRVFAATMTAFSSASNDTILELIGPDGQTIIETDQDDGFFGGTASSISGALITSSATHYLRVTVGPSAFLEVRPYHLHLRVQSGAPVGEIEPNNTIGTAQPLPAAGWIAGNVGSVGDTDNYALNLQAGDSVFLSLDFDPERDGVSWNGRVGFGLFNNLTLVANDTSAISPNSEAFFMTVKETGVYNVYVDSNVPNTGGPTISYHLSVSVRPAAPTPNCTAYASSGPSLPFGPGLTTINSAITVPANVFVRDLNVGIVLTHSLMADLDVTLTAPGGNTIGLFTDVGPLISNQVGATEMNLELDDEAALPIGINGFNIFKGMVYQPEFMYRLAWFDDQPAQGTWTLTVRDDMGNTSGGVLQSWSLTVCATPPPDECPTGTTPVTIYTTDFETNNGGFTHSGTNDTWAWGIPTAAPINTAWSGSNVWKTNLNGTYGDSSSQDLLSPPFNLTNVVGPIYFSWAQKYQMETASFDHLTVELGVVGSSTLTTTLFRHRDSTMTIAVVGTPSTIQEAAGWALKRYDATSYAGQTVQLRFHLDSDNANSYAGLAIDDVQVTACQGSGEPTATATLTSSPTATTEPSATATSTNTATPTATATLEPTVTETETSSPTATIEPTNTATATHTTTTAPSSTPTATRTPTATATVTPGPQFRLYLPLVER